MSNSYFKRTDLLVDTWEFYGKFFKDRPPLTKERLRWRMSFLEEEFRETLHAHDKGDPEEFVDGLIDMMVVILGTLFESEVDIEAAWNEVHRANMTKIRGEKPTRPGSNGVDLIKPEGWIPPSHRRNVARLRAVMDGYTFRPFDDSVIKSGEKGKDK